MLLRTFLNILFFVFPFFIFSQTFNENKKEPPKKNLTETNINSIIKRADKKFNNYNFTQSIRIYKKALKKDENNIYALKKIAKAYEKLHNYKEAEYYYSKLVSIKDIDPEYYLLYGKVLKNNNKLDDAKKQFLLYAQKVPNDPLGKALAKSCDLVKEWETQGKRYKIVPLKQINTKFSEFSPILFKNKLIFTSNRKKDILNNKKFEWNKQPYLSIYAVNVSSDNLMEFGKVKIFSSKLQSEYHDGPVTISKDGKFAFFNQVKMNLSLGKDKINRIKLYSFEIKGKKNNKITNIKDFPYNSDDYSIITPALSDNGEKLFFASDMPGGYGGMDIYVSERTQNGWSKPKNLGEKINTKGNEVFPYYYKGKLYFSSDGHPGYGGLDIFVAFEDSSYSKVYNMKGPLNSNADDFGIFFVDDKNGYFSSDRQNENSSGSDDLYHFTVLSLKPTQKIQGIVLLKNKMPAKNIKLKIFDENKNLIDSTTTNDIGQFVFKKLNVDENYIIKISEYDSSKFINANIFLMNEKGKKVLKLNLLSLGKYSFKVLPPEEFNKLKEIKEEDVETMFKINFFGKVYKKLPGDLPPGMKVYIVNDEDQILYTTTIDEEGNFIFEKIPADENYTLKLENNIEDAKLVIINDEGEIVDIIKAENGKYTYKRLKTDDYFNLELINEEDVPVLLVLNKNGEILRKLKPDENGYFIYKKLNSDEFYKIEVKNINDTTELFVYDMNNKLVNSFKGINGKFHYVRLNPEEHYITLIDANDAIIKIKEEDKFVIPNIYYEYKKWDINKEAAKQLDKLIMLLKRNPHIAVELSSYTDSRGSAKYNLELSEKRALAAAEYLISKGIDKSRISSKGYGETRPVNKCVDGVECSEKQHQQNRRTEFKIKEIKKLNRK